MSNQKQQLGATHSSFARQLLDTFRYRLAHADALPQLAILGTISGLLAGLIAIAFRLAIEVPLGILLPDGSESFEALPLWWRFGLPVGGFLLIALAFHFYESADRATGVRHVINRLHQHQAHLPLKNAVVQFLGGVAAVISGGPLGREGPAVHLGAAGASLLGQRMQLPNNSLRTLVGCGVAAAIAASFNTPLAGVVFAMEVVLVEYTIAGFTPVILAAVSGAVMSRLVFGSDPAFAVPPVNMGSLLEMPFFVLCGLLLGLLSSAMLYLFRRTSRFSGKPVWLKFLVAGLITGALAVVFPQIQGIGYDTVEQALLGQLGMGLLLGIVAAKLIASTIAAALDMPGGIIGPTFVIGACMGSALGIVGSQFNPENAASPGFYAFLGMGAMMAAVLNAPLAALIAVLELTYNPNILLPSMLVIIIANITARLTTGLPGIFYIGLDINRYSSPVFQTLSRAGVTSLMVSQLAHHGREITWAMAKESLEQKPDWIVIEDVGADKYILRPADLARYLENQDKSLWEQDHPIDLTEIPAEERWRLFPVHERATLQEAMLLMRQENGNAVYIRRANPLPGREVAGVVTRMDIDNYYQ